MLRTKLFVKSEGVLVLMDISYVITPRCLCSFHYNPIKEGKRRRNRSTFEFKFVIFW